MKLKDKTGKEHGFKMNYKLEKFWNSGTLIFLLAQSIWTINLKSFEILRGVPLLAPVLDEL